MAITAKLIYAVTIGGTNRANTLRALVELLDANGILVANNTDFQSELFMNRPNIWEPYGMNRTHACTEESYLYS
jgi:hypothetical protein